MTFDELIDFDLYQEALENGWLRRTLHPTEPLEIVNYTQRCQFDRAWNAVTRQCRGLIVHTETGEIVARPWPKFHNYGEHLSVTYDTIPLVGYGPTSSVEVGIWDDALGVLSLDAPIEVTDKLDGSLGIVYRTSDSDIPWAIATRGSFTSEQALHGTDLLLGYLAQGWYPAAPHWTYLFEIVYPSNRIVVDYGDRDELVLLDVLEIETGLPVRGQKNLWSWGRAERYSYRSLAEALAAEPRPNCEGFVGYFPDSNQRVKIKQDDYVALHRILTGTNARNVWEVAAVHAYRLLIRDPKHWGSFLGIDPARAAEVLALGDDWLDGVPDEFHAWVRDVMISVTDQVKQSVFDANEISDAARAIKDRRARYEFVRDKNSGLVTEIMRLASEEDEEKKLEAASAVLLRAWREACPAPTSPFARSEDVS